MYNINLAPSSPITLKHSLEPDITKVVRIRGHGWGRSAYLLLHGSGVHMRRYVLLQSEVILRGLVVHGILKVHRVHSPRAASIYDKYYLFYKQYYLFFINLTNYLLLAELTQAAKAVLVRPHITIIAIWP